MHSKIDPSKLAAVVMLHARRPCRSRRETAFSPKSTAGSSEKPNLMEVLSLRFEGEAQIVGGVLELAAD